MLPQFTLAINCVNMDIIKRKIDLIIDTIVEWVVSASNCVCFVLTFCILGKPFAEWVVFSVHMYVCVCVCVCVL